MICTTRFASSITFLFPRDTVRIAASSFHSAPPRISLVRQHAHGWLALLYLPREHASALDGRCKEAYSEA